MKYLLSEGELVKVIPGSEAMEVALKLALGAEYGQFDVDPFEAAVLIGFIQDFAVEKRDTTLLASCEKSLADMRVLLDAFVLVIDTAKGINES